MGLFGHQRGQRRLLVGTVEAGFLLDPALDQGDLFGRQRIAFARHAARRHRTS